MDFTFSVFCLPLGQNLPVKSFFSLYITCIEGWRMSLKTNGKNLSCLTITCAMCVECFVPDSHCPWNFDKIWLKVTKVIDRLHLRNHKNKECHQLFSPEPFKEKNPHLNTPVTEQVFTWAARFKKILCAMPQERFLFYYHRMVVRRNRYTSRCHRESRLPVLPKVRSQFSTWLIVLKYSK